MHGHFFFYLSMTHPPNIHGFLFLMNSFPPSLKKKKEKKKLTSKNMIILLEQNYSFDLIRKTWIWILSFSFFSPKENTLKGHIEHHRGRTWVGNSKQWYAFRCTLPTVLTMQTKVVPLEFWEMEDHLKYVFLDVDFEEFRGELVLIAVMSGELRSNFLSFSLLSLCD